MAVSRLPGHGSRQYRRHDVRPAARRRCCRPVPGPVLEALVTRRHHPAGPHRPGLDHYGPLLELHFPDQYEYDLLEQYI